jgi:L-ascorbate metabolism protein UlaG (beta-lactamase superfamily)
MKVTYYGHSCFSVRTAGKTLLFDPFIRPNQLASKIKVEELKPDVILISHGHWDHLADVEEIAKNSGAKLIANFEIINWLSEKKLENGHPMNTGGGYNFDWGTARMTPALHSSGLPDGKYGGCAGGFTVQIPEGNFYYAGDTALSYDFKLIGESIKLDLAILPIGDNFTMGIEDAIKCADFVKADKVMGVHYDTFPAIAIDKEVAVRKFKEAGKELLLLEIGEEREL